jgi:rRNA-processing protein EBP2
LLLYYDCCSEAEDQLAEHREARARAQPNKGNKSWQPLKSRDRSKRDEKFGYGGRKRGSRQNTRDSAADMTEFSSKTGVKLNKKGRRMRGAPPAHMMKGGGKKGGKKRPGKNARKHGK